MLHPPRPLNPLMTLKLPFITSNPWADLEQRLAGQDAELQSLSWMVAANQALLLAIVQTHPNPKAVADLLMDSMDRMADVLKPERVPQYREEVQRLLNAVLQISNLR